MLKIPTTPFRAVEVDDDDPFVVNALREHKHYEACWCGSGKKYKKCHRNRGNEKPYALGKLLNLQKKIFWRKRGCMHPNASTDTCRGKIIDSHTIQRKGPLEKIVDESGHVMHFQVAEEQANLKTIGWRKASVFPGFCSYHDSSLFEPIEKQEFTGALHQCLLHAFRNVCNEYYKKQALIESLEFQRGFVDRGLSVDEQINTQLSYITNIQAHAKSLEELGDFRDTLEEAIRTEHYDGIESRCYFFRGKIDVVSSSVLHCEFDFSGNRLIDMWNLELDAELLSHTIIATDEGGAIIFTWLREQDHPAIVVDSFDAIPDQDKGDIFTQYCFINFENIYFSEQWWDGLPESTKSTIRVYANTLYYEGGTYVANATKLVNWEII